MSAMNTLRAVLGVLVGTGIAAACGGGGGDAASGSATSGNNSGSSGGSAQAVVASGTLAASVPAASYAGGSSGASAFAELNALRQAAGAGELAQSAALDVSSQAHADYLIANLLVVGITHYESAALTGFYGVAPSDRIARAGFVASWTTEVIGGSGASNLGSDCVLGLLNTVYHGAALLSEETAVGFGFDDDAGNLLCVSDLATQSSSYGQVPASGNIVAYPYPNQTGVFATFYVSGEEPRVPTTLLPNQTAGTPVIVRLRNADYVNAEVAGTLAAVVSKFTLTDNSGNTISSVVLGGANVTGSGVAVSPDENLSDGFVILVPQAPLNASTPYLVKFEATVSAAGVPISKTWSFVTE